MNTLYYVSITCTLKCKRLGATITLSCRVVSEGVLIVQFITFNNSFHISQFIVADRISPEKKIKPNGLFSNEIHT